MNPMKNYDAIIVTGASRGIGYAVAEDLVSLTRRLFLWARAESVHELAKALSSPETSCYGIQTDLGDPSAVEQAAQSLELGQDAKSIAVVLAGGTLGEPGGVLTAPLECWAECFLTNLVGNVALLRGLASHIRRAETLRVVFFAGGGAAYQYPLFQPYAASKVAVVRTAENFAAELRELNSRDVSVIALAPGAVETAMLSAVRAAGGSVKTAVDISEPVSFIRRFLATDNQQHLSGRFIHVRDDVWSGDSSLRLMPDGLKLRRIE